MLKKGLGLTEALLSMTLLTLLIVSTMRLNHTLANNVDKTKENIEIASIIQNTWKEVAIEDYNYISNSRKQYHDSNYDVEIIVGDSVTNKQNKIYKPITLNVYNRATNKKIKSLTGRKPQQISGAVGLFKETGWAKLPNGMIYQWGYRKNDFLSGREMENLKITYPKTDVKSCFNGKVTLKMSNSVSGTIIPYIKSIDNTGIIVNIDAANGASEYGIDGIYWQAICKE